MKNTIGILQKVLVNHFYKVNTGFFLFTLFMLFGTPHSIPEFHLSIITIIVQNQAMLLAAMVVWLLYNFKCMDYVIKQLRQPRQQFLYCLHNLSYSTCYMYLLYVQVLVYMPVLAYSLFVAGMAIKTHYTFCFVEIILFTTTVVGLTPVMYVKVLLRQGTFKSPIPLPRISLRIGKPLFSVPLYYIWRSRKQMLFVTKLFSLLLLFAFIKLYEPERYDIRPMLLCFMVATAGNSAIVYEMKNFEDFFLQHLRNFPLTITRRFATTMLTHVVLLLPELLFIWKGYPAYFTIAGFIQVLLLGVGLLSIFYASLLTDDMNMDAYMKIIFAILVILFFTILYNPGLLLEVLLLAVSFGLYYSYYYDFEKKYE